MALSETLVCTLTLCLAGCGKEANQAQQTSPQPQAAISNGNVTAPTTPPRSPTAAAVVTDATPPSPDALEKRWQELVKTNQTYADIFAAYRNRYLTISQNQNLPVLLLSNAPNLQPEEQQLSILQANLVKVAASKVDTHTLTQLQQQFTQYDNYVQTHRIKASYGQLNQQTQCLWADMDHLTRQWTPIYTELRKLEQQLGKPPTPFLPEPQQPK